MGKPCDSSVVQQLPIFCGDVCTVICIELYSLTKAFVFTRYVGSEIRVLENSTNLTHDVWSITTKCVHVNTKQAPISDTVFS